MQSELPPNRLKELREARGWKPYNVAHMIGADPSTVYRWETGQSKMPDRMKLKLADLYGVTIAYMMGWPEHADAA